jgi:hypothetical protein
LWKNPENIWKKLSTKYKRLIKTENGQTIMDPKEMAQVLADHFKSASDTFNYTQEFQQIKIREEFIPITPDETGVEEYNKLFTIRELYCKGSSPGPDDVHFQMIKELP